MMNTQLFNAIDQNVNIQIQKKRRKNIDNGMFSAPLELLGLAGMGIGQGGFGQGQGSGGWGNENNGWGNQGGNGWGNEGGSGGWGGNQGFQENLFGKLGMEMALIANEKKWGNDLEGIDWVVEQMKRQSFKIVPASSAKCMAFDDINEQQMTFLEPSPAMKKLEELKREGKQFYDTRFPPNNESLCGEHGHIKEWASISWSKIGQCLPNSVIFNDKVEPGDIKQGYLGDCYFLAGLAALAERPDRIFNLFLLREVNSVRYFSVKMLYKGKWMTIDMDEHIPVMYNKPAFSSSIGNELWVVLLEKAWAKMYTSYKRIEAGLAEEALHDLTGAPIKNISMRQAGFDKEKQWQYLVMASQREYSMVCSSMPGSDTNKSASGVVLGHAYTFLNATVLNYQGGSDRIVQLRNPWGKDEPRGKWSDSDPNWQRVPQSELQRIGSKGNANDGTFFMSYDDFIREFRAIAVAEINDNASYVYKSFTDKNIEGGYFKIQILQNGYYSFHMDKTPERAFEDKIQNSYNYPTAKLELARVQGNRCEKLQGCVSQRRTLFMGYQLTPGTYVAYTKMDFDRNFEVDYDINLAVYAEFACNIELASRQLAVMMSGNQSVRWNPAQHQQQQPGAWNNLGNNTYQEGDSGWGNFGGQGGQGGWGQQQGGQGGWGQQGGGGWGGQGQGGSNDGWGGGQGGWGQQQGGQGGWGGQQGGQGGWGGQQGGQGGWGQQGGQGGWGDSSQGGWGGDSQWDNSKPPHNSWGGGEGSSGW